MYVMRRENCNKPDSVYIRPYRGREELKTRRDTHRPPSSEQTR